MISRATRVINIMIPKVSPIDIPTTSAMTLACNCATSEIGVTTEADPGMMD